MKHFFLILIFSQVFLVSCSSVRESAGVNRKSIDEYQVIENPPLVIPPDFNLLPPEQLASKNIEDIEKELAKEILFGLDDSKLNSDESTSTMEKILKEVKADSVENNIRNQIDENFANEKSSSNYQNEWETESEVLDSIKESERLRNQLLTGEITEVEDAPIVEEKPKTKKRKKFFFF